jgi:hypothetical protein
VTTSDETTRKHPIGGELAEIVGRPRSHSLFWLVVATALGVDIATFYQVLVQVLDEPDQLVWVVVVGFAVVALTLAHYAGLHLRQALNPRNVTGSALWGVLASGVWLLLGGLAFVVRYFTSLDTGGDSSTFIVDGKALPPPSSSADLTSQHYTALLFLALYAATGTITALAGYFRQEPAAWQFGRAVEKRSVAVQQHAGTSRELSRIEQTLESIHRARARQEEAWGNAQAQCEAAARRLKREARLMIARNAALEAAQAAEEERAAAAAGAERTTGAPAPPPESARSETLRTEAVASEETGTGAGRDPGSGSAPGSGYDSPTDLKSEFGLGLESEAPATAAPGSEAAPEESEPAEAAPGPARPEEPLDEPGFLPTAHLPARPELEPTEPEAAEPEAAEPEAAEPEAAAPGTPSPPYDTPQDPDSPLFGRHAA